MIFEYKPDLTAGDLAAIFTTLFIAIVTIFYVKKQLKESHVINSSNVGLNVFVELRILWQEFRSCEENDKKFKFIQLMDYLEYCCYLHWSGVITKDNSFVAFKSIEDQLYLIFKNKEATNIFESARNDDMTYLNIRKFKCRYIDDKLDQSST